MGPGVSRRQVTGHCVLPISMQMAGA